MIRKVKSMELPKKSFTELTSSSSQVRDIVIDEKLDRKNSIIFFLLNICFQDNEKKVRELLKNFYLQKYLSLNDVLEYRLFLKKYKRKSNRLLKMNSECLDMDENPVYFKIEKLVGEGNFGKVYAARHVIDEQRYALKKMKIDQSDQEDIEYFLQETKILAVCQHPNIVRYYSSFFEKDSWYIQMEFCPLNLLQLLEKDILPISRKCLIILDIVRGIQYLHSLHYIHFDLKPDNILLQGQTAKIADFGLSMLKRNCSDQDNIGGSIYCPAFLTKLTPYIDIYAVGVITMEMFCPVFTTNMEKMIVLREKIMQKDYHLLKGQSQYSRILTRFLELCFCPNTTIDDICSLLGIGKIMN